MPEFGMIHALFHLREIGTATMGCATSDEREADPGTVGQE
jgi:hypothetical protein